MKRIMVLAFLIFSFFSCMEKENNLDGSNGKDAGFDIHRGLNVSHWLSQTKIRGLEREEYVTEKDFELIADLGFDHVRLPIDEEHMWTEEGIKEKDAFTLMHNAVKWSLKYNLRVIIDLHVLRSHHFNRPDSRKLWEEKSAQEGFIKFWHQLSDELKIYPNNMVAYEPLNEAVSENPEDWNKLINWVISEIRKLEPNRTIIMGSNNWQQVGTFKELRVPENDKNIILSFHYYIPFALTHYKTSWNEMKHFEGDVTYPGYTIDTNLYKTLNPKALSAVKNHNGYFNKNVLEEDIKQAIDVAKNYNLKLYCGEFGCYPSTDIDMRTRWYNDMIDIFDIHEIAWSHWNYKNDFPVVNEDLTPINKILETLLKK